MLDTICPVCEYRNLTSDQTTCAQCGADLDVFTLISHLDRRMSDTATSSRNTLLMRWGLGLLLIGVVAAGLILSLRPIPQPAYPDRRAEVLALQEELSTSKKDLDTLRAKEYEPFLWRYTLRRGDNLRRLALQFYGSEDRYIDIVYANATIITDPSHIEAGRTILVPLER